MAQPGTEDNGADDSLDALLDGEAAPDTTSDTPAPEAHTPAEPDVEKLLADLQKVQDKIPADKLRFLDKQFQPAFNQRLNQLRDQVGKGVGSVLDRAGVKLPPGKSAFDLLTEDDGKKFFDAVQDVVGAEVAPVKQEIARAKHEQVLGQVMNLARSDDPLVDKHFQKAIAVIDTNPRLAALALEQGGTGLYDVLAGVSRDLELREVQAKNAELQKLIDANKIAKSTAKPTSRAGGLPRSDKAKPKSIREIAAGVLEGMDT